MKVSTMSEDDNRSKETTTPQPYTVFTTIQRRYLTYLLGYLTLASSLTATIYFPLIDLLSQQYDVSIQAINLTITLYVVLQAVSPAIWAPISDTLGRRPVFLVTFLIYCCASLGLALNKASYVALLLLRGLQSIGGSAVMSLAYAVVADISHHSERGKILGPLLASTNLGPCIGPVIGGGAILASGEAQWCFWALVIFGVSSLLLIAWTLPETARSVVGDGSVAAQSIWRTWWSLLRSGFFPDRGASSPNDINAGSRTGRGRLTVPNPLACMRIIFYWDTFLVLWLAASSYAVWYCIQTSIPLIYGQQDYGLNDLMVGLCYLPGGFGVIFGGLVAGRLMDWSYKRTAKEAGFGPPTDDQRVVRHDIHNNFPIEKARSRGSVALLCLSICALVGYGWVVERHVHLSVPLILQFLIGAKCTIILQMFSALLVDLFPRIPGTAAASNNITRCALSAGAVAVLDPLVKAIGKAWFFTLIGIIDGVAGVVAVCLLRRWGGIWRQKRQLASC